MNGSTDPVNKWVWSKKYAKTLHKDTVEHEQMGTFQYRPSNQMWDALHPSLVSQGSWFKDTRLADSLGVGILSKQARRPKLRFPEI